MVSTRLPRSSSLHLPVFLLIYNLAVRLYVIGINIVSFWNPKARLWVRGRKNIFTSARAALSDNKKPVIWMHSSSLGEFEQGRSLLESLRSMYPQCRVVVTFFSPSGYEIMKNNSVADDIFYLPSPTRENATKFIDILDPSLVLWIKYDYWYHYLHELKKRRIPLLLVSAIFHRHQPFFRWYGGLYKDMLRCFTWLFVQTQESARKLSLLGFSNVSVSGDTRFDRVIDIARNFKPIDHIEEFIGSSRVIVAGSTWPEDEEELGHYANTHPEIKFIIAPHEVDEEHLLDIEKIFQHSQRYSAFKKLTNKNTLIIDNIGMLSRLYRYASIAYVGGGFGSDGVHNVLEAAVYGRPVVFGPVFNKFREAIGLLEEGGAFTIETALELEQTLERLLSDKQLYLESCTASREFVYLNKGATQSIVNYIQANRLLIS